MKNLPWIVIMALLSVLFFRECTRPVPCKDKPQVILDTIPGDTVVKDSIINHWHPVFIDTGSTQWLTTQVDTAAILKDYLSRVIYDRVLKDDSSAFIALRDTVSENRLHGAKLSFQNRRRQVTQTIINPPEYDYRFYVGAGAGASPNSGAVSAGAMMTTKSMSYAVDYDIFNRMVTVHLYVPVMKFKSNQ